MTPSTTMIATVRLFAGRIRQLPDDSRTTGMYKTAVDGRVHLGSEGLDGDEQADRRVHGGRDKALHFYPPDHYATLAARFPAAAALLIPGSLGENISAAGLDEDCVRLGDVFSLGGARLEVSQPRQPCWKIDARFGVDGMTEFIATSGLTGGYLRVLEAGDAASGDLLQLVDRHPEAPTLAEFWRLWLTHRPELDALQQLALAPGLPENWRRRISERVDWLRR